MASQQGKMIFKKTYKLGLLGTDKTPMLIKVKK